MKDAATDATTTVVKTIVVTNFGSRIGVAASFSPPYAG